MAALRKASIETEIRELFADAQAAYRKPRVSFLQVELDLKLGRLLAGLHGPAGRQVLPATEGSCDAKELYARMCVHVPKWGGGGGVVSRVWRRGRKTN